MILRLVLHESVKLLDVGCQLVVDKRAAMAPSGIILANIFSGRPYLVSPSSMLQAAAGQNSKHKTSLELQQS